MGLLASLTQPCCADLAKTGLVHVRFTFDRTPFIRMLRALHDAGHQQRTMQLLPPQIPPIGPLEGTPPLSCCSPVPVSPATIQVLWWAQRTNADT